MVGNAPDLYKKIENDKAYAKILFRQALQDPEGAIKSICEIGESVGLPVTPEEVKKYISSLDDDLTKQWLIKARGGL
tara:strand:- start:21 stop:251 length:231 start_codon:yes stop_codon:yes gene_type:complete